MLKGMARSVRVLLLVCGVITMLPPAVFCSEITHSFDQDGLLQHDRKAATGSRVSALPQARRYAVPDGVELRPDVIYEQYPVFGTNFSEIMQSINENAPLSRKGDRRVPADTVWSLSLSYQFSIAPELDEVTGTVHIPVSVTDLAVEYRITITIPALINEAALDPVERNLWKRYMDNLLGLEHSRVKIIKDSELQTALFRDISELNYLSLQYSPGLDLEAIVRMSLHEETEKLGKEWTRTIKSRIEEADKGMSRRETAGTASGFREDRLRP